MRRERGVAIVSVLLIVVLTSALAYHLVSRQEIAIATTRATLEFNQSKHYARAAESIAKTILRQDRGQSEIDHLDEDWAQVTGPFEIPGGNFQIRIVDLQRKLNLNAVGSAQSTELWTLFESVFVEANLDPRVLPIWGDWIDTDQESSEGGMEDYGWLVADPPRRTPDSLSLDLSELNILEPLSFESMAELSSFVDVIPTYQLKLNVNTLQANIASMLHETLINFGKTRRQFESVEQAISAYPGLQEIASFLVVESSFFEIQVVVQYADTRVDLTSRVWIQREPQFAISTYTRDYGQRHTWTDVRSDSFERVMSN